MTRIAGTRAVGRLLVVGSILLLAWPRVVEWGGQGRWGRPPVTVLLLLAAGGWGLLRWTMSRRGRIRKRPVLIGTAATVAVAAAAMVWAPRRGWPLAADPGVEAAGLLVLATATATTGWLLVAVTEPAPGDVPDLSRWPKRLAAVAALATLAATGVLTFASRDVDRVTARALPAVAPGLPVPGARERWRLTDVDGRLEAVAGRYLVFGVRGGVEVRDALTGRHHWHWRERGRNRYRAGPAVSADGRTVMLFWSHPTRPVAKAFDIETGALRWSRRYHGPDELPGLSGAPGLYGIGAVMVIAYARSGLRGHAIDVRTGAVRWSVPEVPDGCGLLDAVEPAADALVVAMRCFAGDGLVAGVAAADGTLRWTKRVGRPVSTVHGDEPSWAAETGLHVQGDTVFVWSLGGATLAVDAVTGAERFRHGGPSGGARRVFGDGVTGYVDAVQVVPDDGWLAVRVTGVDQITGTVRGTAAIGPQPAGSDLEAAVAAGQHAYLGFGGPGRLVAVDLGTGAIRLDMPVADPGRSLGIRLTLGPGLLIVTTWGLAGDTMSGYG